jgi:non-specific protein-tyrosine kinase
MTDDHRPVSGEHGDTAAFLAAVRDHSLFVFFALGVAGLAAIAYLFLAPKRYVAEADVLVTPVSTDDENLKGLGLLTDPSGSVFTTARLLERPQVTDRVEARLGLHLTRLDLLAKLKITPLPQSDLVTVEATESSPKRAAALANTFAGELIDERTRVFQARLQSTIARLEARVAAEQQVSGQAAAAPGSPAQLLQSRIGTLKAFRGGDDPTLEIWTAATPPDAAKPKSVIALVVIFLAAALLAGGTGLAFEFLSPRVRRRSSLPVGMTLLVSAPFVRRRLLVNALAGDARLPEKFWDAWRLVRSRLVTERVGGERATSVLVTSPSRGEGKTEAAACLAVVLAASGVDVVLVEADLRNPRLAELFGVDAAAGMADVLEERLELRNALVAIDGLPGLRMLPAGRDSRDLVDLVEPTSKLLEEIKREAEMVVVDGPALTESAEGVALTAVADTVIVSVRSGQTRVEKLGELAATLRNLQVPVLGVVLRERRKARGSRTATPRHRGEPKPEASPLRSEVA